MNGAAMPRPRLGAATLLVAVTLGLGVTRRAVAEEYDVTVTLRGETPVAVLFLRCSRNGEVPGNEETPPFCKERDAERTFSTTAARITNLGSSIVWVHIGRARVPVLPGHSYVRRRPTGAAPFDRLFLSGDPGATAHVFASYPVEDEPETPPAKDGRSQPRP